MANETKVGVVTVTYNSAGVIDGFLRSILRQSHRHFVLFVIDNASSDTTLRQLATYGDTRIVVKAESRNLGLAAGNNQGIRASLEQGCDAVLIINNDTEFEPALLEKLIAGLEEHAGDMIVPKMYYFDPPDKIWCAGGQFNRMKGYLSVHYGENQMDRGQYDRVREVEFAPMACMMIRSNVFARIGLIDEQYFLYFDDNDFCLRAKRAGLKLIYLPSATLRHKVSALAKNSPSVAHYMIARNHVYFIRKNLSLGARLVYLPAYQFRLVLKSLFRILDWKEFAQREKGFLCGLRIAVSRAGVEVAGGAEGRTAVAKAGKP